MSVDDDWDMMHELSMVGGMGSVSPEYERPPKKKKKVYRRPIGFITDIDKLIEAD